MIHDLAEPATTTTLQDFLSFALQLTRAVQRFHEQGSIHGAITPDVIVVDRRNGAVQLLPGDIRSAHWLAYAAPEQTGRMNHWIDQRTDLHALGVIFYELLTGQLPFAAGDPLGLVHALMAAQPPPLAQGRRCRSGDRRPPTQEEGCGRPEARLKRHAVRVSRCPAPASPVRGFRCG